MPPLQRRIVDGLAGPAPQHRAQLFCRACGPGRASFATWLRAGPGPLIHPCTVVQTFPARSRYWSTASSDPRAGACLTAPPDYPRRPDPVGERWRSVPAALWPGIRLFFSTPTLGFEQLGSALSVALALVGTRITLSQAAASLGSLTTAASVSRVLQAMHRDSRWPDMLAALTGLAELLDAGNCPINYAKRRDLPFASFLPEEKLAANLCRHRAARGEHGSPRASRWAA